MCYKIDCSKVSARAFGARIPTTLFKNSGLLLKTILDRVSINIGSGKINKKSGYSKLIGDWSPRWICLCRVVHPSLTLSVYALYLRNDWANQILILHLKRTDIGSV